MSYTTRRRVGRALSGLAALLLFADALGKVMQADPVVRSTVDLGYPASVVLALGLIELACIAAYATPRTTVLGAILLTGYLGGAVATHVRIGSPLLTHVLFPIYLAALVWGGLFLREGRLGTLVPLRAPA